MPLSALPNMSIAEIGSTSLTEVFVHLIDLVQDHQDGIDKSSPDKDVTHLITKDGGK